MSTPISERASNVLGGLKEAVQGGAMPAHLFNDEEIWHIEQERLFGRAWCFLAHETEIPKPGDYVVRHIANNNIIVARTENGEIRANLNMCRHRGNMMCKSDMGNASHFRCSYHGWVYKNTGDLIGVPYMNEGYEGELKRKDWGLIPVRIDSYEGLIFGTLDDEAEELSDYLSDFTFYLDMYLRPGAEGAEVYGPPDRWLADTDWKICAENFNGDGYHTPVAHQFGFHLGYFRSSGATHSQGWAASIPGKGHGVGLGHTPDFPAFAGFPEATKADMKETFSEDQWEVFSKVRTAVGLVFPNLAFLMQPFSMEPGEVGVRFVTMRLYRPYAPGKMEMLSWCLVPKSAPQEYKDEAYKAYTLAFGQAGTFEQDDFENWTKVTRNAASSLLRHRNIDFPYIMGIKKVPLTREEFAGPGHVVSPYVNDSNFRNLWSRYADYMSEEV